MTENTNMTGHFTKRGGLSHKTSITLPLSSEVPVPSKES